MLVGEAKWARQVDGAALAARLLRGAAGIPAADPVRLRPVVCARSAVDGLPDGALGVTAADIMSGDPAE